MATDTAKSKTNSADLDQFIEKQIQVTRSHVKIVSVATGITTLVAGVLAFLILLSVIDHWVWGLSVWMRLLALVVLLAGSATFFVRRILPGLMRSVNPVYAAQAIEQSSDSLKNSLINFLFLRRRDGGVRQLIYDGVRRQAANDLHHVQIDSAVDRSELIRVGYVLAALVVLLGVYRILSPKDPFQTVARVAAPWKSIARPSRATIERVEPGNAEIYRGQSLQVSAVVDGLREDEGVRLVFSTVDGQMIDQAISMLTDEAGHRHLCELTTGSTGIQHDLSYRIQAGDAQTEPYRVMVKDAPSINVQRITYQYPNYTKRAAEEVERQGDLVALEGTRVQIQALANQPIRSAYLELFDDSGDDRPVKSVPMTHKGELAEGHMTLTLRADRKTPTFAAYQLRFQNADGDRNEEPARYQIEVTPDLSPLVEILNPRRREVELPENRELMIEVRSLDPDFALNAVRLHAAAAGLELLKHPLLDSAHEGQGVFVYRLQPNRLGLSAGDTLIYWAEAEDNRRAAGTNSPAPNLTRSENYRIRVVSPDETAEEGEADDSKSSDQQDDSQTGDSGGQNGEQGGEGTESGSTDAEGASEGSESGDGTEGDQDTESEAGEEDAGTGTGGAGGTGESDADSNSEQESGDANSADGGSASETASPDQQGDSDAAGESRDQGETGEGTAGEGASGEARPSDGTGSGGQPQSQEAVPSDGSNDADAIERILEHRQKDSSASQPRSDTDADQQADESADSTADSQSEGSGAGQPGENENQPIGDPTDADATDANSAQPNDADRDESSGAGREQETPERSPDSSDASEQGDTGDANGANRQRRAASDAEASQDHENSTGQRPADADASARPGSSADNDQRTTPQTDAATDASDAQTRDSANQDSQATPDSNPDASATEARQPTSDDRSRQETSPTDAGAQDNASPSDANNRDANNRDANNRDANNRDANNRDANNRDANNRDASPGDFDSDANSSSEPKPDEGPNQGQSSEGASAGNDASEQQSSDPDGDPQARTGGRAGDDSGTATDSFSGEPGEDEANLDYSRKATDLALEHLRDQQDNRELLDKLGWTPEDVRNFLSRWQQMKRDANQQGARGNRARQQMDDQLRGLGLRPGDAQTRSIQRKDGFTRLRDDGALSTPPPQYRDHYRAFLRGMNRDRKSDSDR